MLSCYRQTTSNIKILIFACWIIGNQLFIVHYSVDDYLEWCAELGEEPDKPFSGKIPFRTTTERHHQIYLAAKKANKSINSWMDDVLAEAVD